MYDDAYGLGWLCVSECAQMHTTIFAYLLHMYAHICTHTHTNITYTNNLFCPWNNNTVCPSTKLVCVGPSDSSLPGIRLSQSHVQCHWNALWLASSWDSPIHYLAQKPRKGDSGKRMAQNNSWPIGIQHLWPPFLPFAPLRIPGGAPDGKTIFSFHGPIILSETCWWHMCMMVQLDEPGWSFLGYVLQLPALRSCANQFPHW